MWALRVNNDVNSAEARVFKWLIFKKLRHMYGRLGTNSWSLGSLGLLWLGLSWFDFGNILAQISRLLPLCSAFIVIKVLLLIVLNDLSLNVLFGHGPIRRDIRLCKVGSLICWCWRHGDLEQLHEGLHIWDAISDCLAWKELSWILLTWRPLSCIFSLRWTVMSYVADAFLAAGAAHASHPLMTLQALSAGPPPRPLPGCLMIIRHDMFRRCHHEVVIRDMRSFQLQFEMTLICQSDWAHWLCQQLIFIWLKPVLRLIC